MYTNFYCTDGVKQGNSFNYTVYNDVIMIVKTLVQIMNYDILVYHLLLHHSSSETVLQTITDKNQYLRHNFHSLQVSI